MIPLPSAGTGGRIPPRWDQLTGAEKRQLSASAALRQRQRQGLPARVVDREFLAGLGRALDVVFDAEAIGHVEVAPLHGRIDDDRLEKTADVASFLVDVEAIPA